MQNKCKSHRFGGIHGICMFTKSHIAKYCSVLTEFILCAVYLTHQMSEYYHENVIEYLSNDIITINAVYNIPILLLGAYLQNR